MSDTQATSKTGSASPFEPYSMAVYVSGIFGSNRDLHGGGSAEAAYCLPVGERTCLEIGGGVSMVGSRGLDTTVSKGLIVAPDIELITTPMFRLAATHYLTSNFGLGLVGRAGYSFIKAGADEVKADPPSITTKDYSGGGAAYEGLLLFLARFSGHFGIHGGVGVKSMPGSHLKNDGRSNGIVGQAGMTMMF